MNGRSRGFFGLILALSVMIVGGVALAQHPARGVSDEPTQQTEASIEQLTRQARVVAYLQANQRLPDYYITKRQARAAGWDPLAATCARWCPGGPSAAIVSPTARGVCRSRRTGSGVKPI